MRRVVGYAEDAATASASVFSFLAEDPVANNVILTLLHERERHPEPFRCWWVTSRGDVKAVAVQSPRTAKLIVTDLEVGLDPDPVRALVDATATAAPDLPGVIGPAGSAAAFAGRWTEQQGVGASPIEGQRLYRLGEARPPTGVTGAARAASPADASLVERWVEAFHTDTGGAPATADGLVARRVADGEIWLWRDDGDDVAMARLSVPVAGAARVGSVYTPPPARRRGYAAALVAAVGAQALAAGTDSCLLFTQLSNPTSNAVYRRIGYEAVHEVLSYRFVVIPGSGS